MTTTDQPPAEHYPASKRKVGNLLALAVLAYLTEQPMHPYELARNLRDNGDARSIKFSHGSLYMVVQQLARAGFIAEQETSREGQRPERTVYALTSAGRDELRDWLRELVEQPRHEYPAFVAALSLLARAAPRPGRRPAAQRLGHLAGQQDESRRLIGSGTGRRRARAVPDRGGVPARPACGRTWPSPSGSSSGSRIPATDWIRLWAGFHAEQPPTQQENEMSTGTALPAPERTE